MNDEQDSLYKKAKQRVKARQGAYKDLFSAISTLIILLIAGQIFGGLIAQTEWLDKIYIVSNIGTGIWVLYSLYEVINIQLQQRNELSIEHEIQREKEKLRGYREVDTRRLMISDDGELVEVDELDEKPKRRSD